MRATLILAAVLLAAFAGAGCGRDVAGELGDDGGARDGGTRADLTGLIDMAAPPPDLAEPPAPRDPRRGPPYPLVFVHGMAGFRNIGPLEYFYGVANMLRKEGHDVWVSQQDPLNTSEVRGPQVRKFVETVLAATGKDKVNLIGHSQGGFDVRYVASVMGDKVASVTMVASPMKGAPVADVATGAIPGPALSALGLILDLYGLVLGNYDSNIKAQVQMLTSAGAAAFFARYPDNPSVAYYSVTGRSSRANGDLDCWTPTPVPFVTQWYQETDELNPLFALPGLIMDSTKPAPTHDGLVPVGSARHGMFLGCIPADHLDEIGLLPGSTPGPNNKFNHLTFYRDLAAWLVARGH